MSNPNGSDDASDLAEEMGFATLQEPLLSRYAGKLKPYRESLLPTVAEAKARIAELREELGDLTAYVARKEKQAHKAEVAREKAGR